MTQRTQNNIAILREQFTKMFQHEKTGHSIDHLERVLAYALKICEKEGGNENVVAVASYAHDVHRIIGSELGRFCTPVESLPMVSELIEPLDLTQSEKQHVLFAIEHHEEYAFGKEKVTITDIESKIVQDADNLDAIGAFAIVRAFRYGTANNMLDYDPSVEFYQNEYTESVNDKSTVHHLYNKSLRLGDYLHTQTARDIAKPKTKLIKDFIEIYVKEFNCNF